MELRFLMSSNQDVQRYCDLLRRSDFKAKEQLGWVAEKNLDDMCRDTWNFQNNLLNK